MKLRVLTYNIHKGMSLSDTRAALDSIKEAIDIVNADIVFLQEVRGAHVNITGPQFERLADRVWRHYAYGKNSVYEKGHHGNAILSKFPIVSHENIDISTNNIESRGLLHAVVAVDGLVHQLHLLCAHLSLFESGRRKQAMHIATRIAAAVHGQTPLLLAGDFNDWRERFSRLLHDIDGLDEVHAAVHGYHAKTFPSRFPLFSLDRIYFRGLKPLHAEALTGEPWKRISDHAALFADFEIG